jgi:TonB family protein
MTERRSEGTDEHDRQPPGESAVPSANSTLIVATPGPMAGTPTRDPLIWPTSLLIALAAHAGLILYALAQDTDGSAGAGGQELNAISVTIVSSAVLESRDLTQLKQDVPVAADSVEALDGAPDAASEPPQSEPKKQDVDPDDAIVPEAIFKVEPRPESQPRQNQNTEKGGAAARAEEPKDAKASAQAAASPGSVREYARSVSAALAKTKPKGVGWRGTVVVKLTISPNGSLSLAEVLKSSGDRTLDLKALEAVRQAVFPAPPAGMTVTQLTYQVPYHFR